MAEIITAPSTNLKAIQSTLSGALESPALDLLFFLKGK